MTGRIFRAVFFLSAAVLVVTLLVSIGLVYHESRQEYAAAIAEEARCLAAGVEADGKAYLEAVQAAHRVTWIAGDGTVLFDSVANEATADNHRDREEIKKALTTGEGYSERTSATMDKQEYFYALRLKDGTVVRIAADSFGVGAIFVKSATPLLLLLALILAISALVAYRISKSVMHPIIALDPERPGKTPPYKELTPLIQKIDRQNQTIRGQLREAARHQEEFRAISENMSEGLVLVDRDRQVLAYNNAAFVLLNGTRSDDGLTPEFHPPEAYEEALTAALKGSHSQPLMVLSDRTYQLIANPVKSEYDTAGAVILILDVTERQERDRLRQEFSANVSHELKTPLTSISGFAEIMKNGMVKSEDVPRFAGSIYEEAQRMITLVGDILQLSRLEDMPTDMSMQAVSLVPLVQDVLQRLERDANARNITLRLQGDPCSVWGHPPLLDEMITNLCDNAIKYNKEGGRVTVSLIAKPETVTLVVADTGIGIPYEDQERVFERFFRVDKSHSRQIGGTGLGLSIVKHGALFHHARCVLESIPGEGTSVTLIFPAGMEESQK